MSRIEWVSSSEARREHLSEVLSKTKYKDVFGDAFLEGLGKRYELLESRSLKLLAFQIPIIAFLAFLLLDIQLDFSVLGISAKASKSLREILLVASASLGVLGGFVYSQMETISETIVALATKKTGNDRFATSLLLMPFGISPKVPIFSTGWSNNYFFGEIPKDLRPPLRVRLVVLGGIAAEMIVALMLQASIILIYAWNLVEMYLHPNFSRTVSVLVSLYVVGAFVARTAPRVMSDATLPVHNYDDMIKFAKFLEKYPEKGRELIDASKAEYGSRSFFVRLFTRPTLPKIPDMRKSRSEN